jgi:signal transduction histidine kinase
MRLADFTSTNVEPILVEWESFARSIWPGTPTDPATLRDHAADILRATVVDMRSAQTPAEQEDKSKGAGDDGVASARVDNASDIHGALRVEAGFDMAEVIAEYRALRASVLRLWQKSGHAFHSQDLDDVTRFNEAIDQSLTKAAESYVRHAEHNRKLLADEQVARLGAEAGNHAKQVFLTTLGHEMRTPLTAIAGWAEILGEPTCTKELREEGAEVITRNVAAQIKLIDDILDVSSIIGGKLQLATRECDLIASITDAIESMRAAADAKGITLTADLDPAAGTMCCDSDRMRQVVWNLLANAVKFTPQGGRVTIGLSRDDHATRIRVVDTGVGIEAEFLPHVFERFRQADGSASRQFAGIGLGLAIVKHIVELHGGTAEAFSAGTGQGATVTVTLPVPAERDAMDCEDLAVVAGA